MKRTIVTLDRNTQDISVYHADKETYEEIHNILKEKAPNFMVICVIQGHVYLDEQWLSHYAAALAEENNCGN